MFLIVLFVIALIPAYIASAKGRDFAKWYIYGLLLWIVALPHAISLKEEDVIVCPACKSKVALEALICKYCQTKLDPKYKAEVISKKVEAKAKRKKRDLIGFSVLIVCVIIIVLILRQM